MQSQSESTMSINAITERLKHLLETSHSYVKLKIFQQLAYTMSVFAKLMLIGSLVLFGFVFLCIAGAMAIGSALGAMSYGFLIVGGLIFILAALLFAFRNRIDRQIIRKFSRVFFN